MWHLSPRGCARIGLPGAGLTRAEQVYHRFGTAEDRPPGWTVLGSSEPEVDLLSSGQAGTRQTDTRAAAGTQVPHSAPSADSSGQSSLRFGRTTVQVICGDVFCTDAEAIVCPANRRGMMVAGQTM